MQLPTLAVALLVASTSVIAAPAHRQSQDDKQIIPRLTTQEQIQGDNHYSNGLRGFVKRWSLFNDQEPQEEPIKHRKFTYPINRAPADIRADTNSAAAGPPATAPPAPPASAPPASAPPASAPPASAPPASGPPASAPPASAPPASAGSPPASVPPVSAPPAPPGTEPPVSPPVSTPTAPIVSGTGGPIAAGNSSAPGVFPNATGIAPLPAPSNATLTAPVVTSSAGPSVPAVVPPVTPAGPVSSSSAAVVVPSITSPIPGISSASVVVVPPSATSASAAGPVVIPPGGAATPSTTQTVLITAAPPNADGAPGVIVVSITQAAGDPVTAAAPTNVATTSLLSRSFASTTTVIIDALVGDSQPSGFSANSVISGFPANSATVFDGPILATQQEAAPTVVVIDIVPAPSSVAGGAQAANSGSNNGSNGVGGIGPVIVTTITAPVILPSSSQPSPLIVTVTKSNAANLPAQTAVPSTVTITLGGANGGNSGPGAGGFTTVAQGPQAPAPSIVFVTVTANPVTANNPLGTSAAGGANGAGGSAWSWTTTFPGFTWSWTSGPAGVSGFTSGIVPSASAPTAGAGSGWGSGSGSGAGSGSGSGAASGAGGDSGTRPGDRTVSLLETSTYTTTEGWPVPSATQVVTAVATSLVAVPSGNPENEKGGP